MVFSCSQALIPARIWNSKIFGHLSIVDFQMALELSFELSALAGVSLQGGEQGQGDQGSLSEYFGARTTASPWSAVHDSAVQLSESSQHTQIPFQLTPEQIQRFIAGCGEMKGSSKGSWATSDFSLTSFCTKLELNVNGSDKKVMGPSLRFLDGGIAVIPLYAAYTVHCYLANGNPVHSSMMVKHVMRRFNMGSGENRENKQKQQGAEKRQKQQGAEKRLALGDRVDKFTDENMNELMAMIAPSHQNERMFEFLLKSRESGNRIRFIRGLFFTEGFFLCDHALSLCGRWKRA
jgi:hypothetical protein